MKRRGRPRGSKNKTLPPLIARPAPPPPVTGNDKPLLTLTEAAIHLGHVHRTTIMRWVKEGRIRCIKISRKNILFEITEIERFICEHRYSGD